MKRLLTFIYGIFAIFLALGFEYRFSHEETWFKWFYFVLCVAMCWTAVEKFNKSTK